MNNPKLKIYKLKTGIGNDADELQAPVPPSLPVPRAHINIGPAILTS